MNTYTPMLGARAPACPAPRAARPAFLEGADAPGIVDAHHAEGARLGERRVDAPRWRRRRARRARRAACRSPSCRCGRRRARHGRSRRAGGCWFWYTASACRDTRLSATCCCAGRMSMWSPMRPSRKLQPLQVADQALRLVLRGDADAPHPRVDAVGEREVDDAVLAAEQRRLAAVGEPSGGCRATGEHLHRVGAAHEPADVATAGLGLAGAGKRTRSSAYSPRLQSNLRAMMIPATSPIAAARPRRSTGSGARRPRASRPAPATWSWVTA